MIRVILPSHLRVLARIDGEVSLDVTDPVTQRTVLDALEASYPVLRGTIRGHNSGPRRAFIRFFACEQDLSHEPPDTPLPPAVAAGAEPYLIVGAHGRRLAPAMHVLWGSTGRQAGLRCDVVLADSFGRIATDLRVSVTDRCNLRCSYCMPPEGLDWLPGPALLTDGEISRLIAVAVQRLGVTEVRFTGGEPLLRRGLPGLIAAVAALDPRPEISLTTNGIGLARLAGPLAAAGLDRLNVSLDTLSQQTFKELARRDRLPDVLAGLAAATSAGLAPVKVNAVLMRGINDHEAPSLLRFCLDRGYQLRFIEQMPLDAQHGWRRTDMVTADEILTHLTDSFSLTPDDPDSRGSAPAETFLVDGGPDQVGVIGSVTRPFCGTCDRVRLTADGQIRNCLFATTETDLRTLLRAGADDGQLAAAWRGAVATKLPGHGINDPGFLQPARPMSAIGG